MKEDLYIYDILSDIYKGESYGERALGRSRAKGAFVTRTVYGVLERDTHYEYVIGKLVQKRPKPYAVILLKMGFYMLDYMDSVPDYAAVNRILDCAQELGKGAIKGFLNAVFQRYLKDGVKLPKSPAEKLSVTASVPLWIVNKYISQYGWERAEEFLCREPFTKQHIRHNARRTTHAELGKMLEIAGVGYEDSGLGYFVDWGEKLYSLFKQGYMTMQSLTSMKCCRMAEVADGDNVLDMCSAPGGKAIYLGELADIKVTCCDIHEHRVELIKAYAGRMGADNLEYKVCDCAVEPFKPVYDVVLCDVPCSGLGVAASKPDIYLRRKREDITALSQKQSAILNNAAGAVKNGGKIIYSTCTTLKEENFDVVSEFLRTHINFDLEFSNQFLPDGKGEEGFYAAVLRRKQ